MMKFTINNMIIWSNELMLNKSNKFSNCLVYKWAYVSFLLLNQLKKVEFSL